MPPLIPLSPKQGGLKCMLNLFLEFPKVICSFGSSTNNIHWRKLRSLSSLLDILLRFLGPESPNKKNFNTAGFVCPFTNPICGSVSWQWPHSIALNVRCKDVTLGHLLHIGEDHFLVFLWKHSKCSVNADCWTCARLLLISKQIRGATDL